MDDDPAVLDVLSLLLTSASLTVETAANGNEALGKILRSPPDVIVADVKMDGMSGYELCHMLRDMRIEIPFIFCSALGAPSERVHGLRLGGDDYVVKPFDEDELVLKVQRWASRSRSAQDPGTLQPPPSPPQPEPPKPEAQQPKPAAAEPKPAAPAAAPRPAPGPTDTQPVRPVPGRRKRILMVDDDPESALGIRPYLAGGGYDVVIARSGNDALDLLEADPPDLVILDVVMPILSGLDVCRWIRGNPKTCQIPIILLSARNRPSDMLAGEQAGCDLYVPKGVSPRRLLNIADMLLSRDVPLLKRPPAPETTQ